MDETIFAVLTHILRSLDRQVGELQEEFAEHLQCKKGCSGCCLDGFRIRYIEAVHLLKGFATAPPEVAQAIMDNIENQPKTGLMQSCPLLIDGACSLYEHRPSLCRAYGLIIRLKEKLATCSLNFQNLQSTEGLKALDLEPFYELLNDLSQRLWEQMPMEELGEGPEVPFFSIRTFFEAFFRMQAKAEGLPFPTSQSSVSTNPATPS